ncbi:MAG: CDP-alcohol phosphatidyltransferase family protein [Vicinamibacterales bacterium]
MSLRSNFLTIQAIALVAVVGLGILAGARLRLGEWYPVEAGACFLVMMLLAGRYLREHPFPTLGPANQITTGRAALLALVVSLVFEPAIPMAAAGAAAAAFVITSLDGVDGWLARRTRMESAFGARFDVEIDALLIQALAILAWQHGKAGPWILMSGLLRYLFVAAGSLWPWIGRPLPPSRRGKTICVIELVVLMVVLLPPLAPPWSGRLAAAGLLVLCYSFLVDTIWLWNTSRAA